MVVSYRQQKRSRQASANGTPDDLKNVSERLVDDFKGFLDTLCRRESPKLFILVFKFNNITPKV